MRVRPQGARPDATDTLTQAQRIALCDASNGLLGRFGDAWRRQNCAHFHHSTATVESLVERGLIRPLADDIVQPTGRGYRVASLIRRRRNAVATWERSKCH